MKRLSILMIIFIIRCSHSFNFIKIPQVQVDQLNFVTPEFLKAGQRLASQSINHNVSFTSTPQILLAVERLSFDSGDLNFKATVSSSNSTQFNLTIQRYSDKISYFFNITIRYLAINMKDCFVKTGDLSFQENKYDCDLNMMCEKQTFMYQKSNFDSQKWNVTVGFYFIGIEQVQLQNNNISLSLLNEIVYNSNSFDIIVKTRDKNHYNQINKIYYNYIEIYKQIDNSYYHFSNINNSINPRQNQSNYQAFYPPDYQINIDKLAGIFYGIIEIELTYFNQIVSQINFFIYNLTLIDLNFYNISSIYAIQQGSLISVQSQIIAFAQVNCNQNGTYFLDDQYQCVSSCPDGYYLAHTPDTYYHILNQCLPCDVSCKSCNGPTPSNCLQKNLDDVDRQIRTQCEGKNAYEGSFINCESCQQTANQICISCKQPFVLYQNQCICPNLSQIYNIQTNQCEFKQTSVFSQDTKTRLLNGGNIVNQATLGFSIIFTIAQGFISSGCPLLSQTLTIQKIFYLELINISTPHFLLQFIQAISNEGITKKYQILNIFKYQIKFDIQDNNSTLDYQFKYNIPSTKFLQVLNTNLNF
ncbi:hypothetical protein ABPG73_010156 [Tetrahymena malaccensis]